MYRQQNGGKDSRYRSVALWFPFPCPQAPETPQPSLTGREKLMVIMRFGGDLMDGHIHRDPETLTSPMNRRSAEDGPNPDRKGQGLATEPCVDPPTEGRRGRGRRRRGEARRVLITLNGVTAVKSKVDEPVHHRPERDTSHPETDEDEPGRRRG